MPPRDFASWRNPCGGNKITDDTYIRKGPMKRLLAHVKTKAELTEYLASKTLEKGRQSGKCVVVAKGFVKRLMNPQAALCSFLDVYGRK